MVNRHTAQKIRKIHRYLGLFLGIQFLMWTISGLYFSWSNIDNIHGDQFKNMSPELGAYNNLIDLDELEGNPSITSVELREINNQPYYWVNKESLYSANTGFLKEAISKDDALSVAKKYMNQSLEVEDIQLISETGKHHEYRERLLPAFVISYKEPQSIRAYVSLHDGRFQTVRHRDWRIFDFLWMTHTMDYEGRDNFNNIVLRAFSLLGLITVLSGFLLWYISSPSVRKVLKRKRK